MIIFENDNIVYDLHEGLITCHWKCEHVTIQIAKEVVKDRLEKWTPESYPVLCYIDKIKNTDKDARDFLSEYSSCIGFTKCAIMMKSKIECTIANLFIRFNKPAIPTKLFTKEKEAILWIMT